MFREKAIRGVLSVLSVVFLVFAISSVAFAGTLSFSWTAPTTCTDGTTLVSNGLTITGYSLYCGSAAGGEATTPVWTGSATTASIVVGSNQKVYCYVTATDNEGVSSGPSNEVSKTGPTETPMPPTGLR